MNIDPLACFSLWFLQKPKTKGEQGGGRHEREREREREEENCSICPENVDSAAPLISLDSLDFFAQKNGQQ